MGIDVYAQWDGQSEEEKNAQYTGFSITHGHVGYLREAYHGGPYSTRLLVPEAFDEDDSPSFDLEGDYLGVPIDAALLEQRLPSVLQNVIVRNKRVYNYDENDPDQARAVALEQESYQKFVELCRRKQNETGKPVRIYASY